MLSFALLWKYKYITLAAVLILAVGGYILFLRDARDDARREADAATEENKTLEIQNEGLKTLQNTNTIAEEIERQKQVANQQAINSNLAANEVNAIRNANYANTASADVLKRKAERFERR